MFLQVFQIKSLPGMKAAAGLFNSDPKMEAAENISWLKRVRAAEW